MIGIIAINCYNIHDCWTTISAFYYAGLAGIYGNLDQLSSVRNYFYASIMVFASKLYTIIWSKYLLQGNTALDAGNASCIGVTCGLLIGFVGYFILEQTVLKKIGNFVFTHYFGKFCNWFWFQFTHLFFFQFGFGVQSELI